LITQMEAALLAWKSRAMEGRATFAMLLSSTDMLIARTIVAMAQYLRGTGRPSG
jgi:hypothetical protein